MTPREKAIIGALRRVSFLPASSEKRFAKSMMALLDREPERVLSEKQSRYISIIAWRFRKQIPANLAYPAEIEEIEAAQ